MSLQDSISKAHTSMLDAWSIMGIPISRGTLLTEATLGIVDPEALLLCTLITAQAFTESALFDVAAWHASFRGALNLQRLRTMFFAFDAATREQLSKVVGKTPLVDILLDVSVTTADRTDDSSARAYVNSRAKKLPLLGALCNRSTFIRNRLLFGAGYRGDLISILQIKSPPSSNKHLARIVATSEATISRIVRDLKIGGFIKHHKQQIFKQEYPCMFVSSDSAQNLKTVRLASLLNNPAMETVLLEEVDPRYDAAVAGRLFSRLSR